MRKMRLVVAGPHQAGKSTLIHRLDPFAVRMDYVKGTLSTTVGFDFGIVLWDATTNRIFRRNELNLIDPTNEIWKVTLTGLPGQIAFEPVRRALIKGKDGAVIVIDSTRPVQFVYALSQYNEIRKELGGNAPVALLANKQDLPHAKDPGIIRELLNLDAEVIPISALRGDNVERSFLDFLVRVRKSVLMRNILTRGF